MRTMILAAAFVLAAAPAFAQSSTRASNINAGDTRSTIAPRLPDPQVGADAGPEGFLRAAQQALRTRQTGRAQEALERAQTRMLDRSTPQGQIEPYQGARFRAVEQARQALGTGDIGRAQGLIDQALSAGTG